MSLIKHLSFEHTTVPQEGYAYKVVNKCSINDDEYISPVMCHRYKLGKTYKAQNSKNGIYVFPYLTHALLYGKYDGDVVICVKYKNVIEVGLTMSHLLYLPTYTVEYITIEYEMTNQRIFLD